MPTPIPCTRASFRYLAGPRWSDGSSSAPVAAAFTPAGVADAQQIPRGVVRRAQDRTDAATLVPRHAQIDHRRSDSARAAPPAAAVREASEIDTVSPCERLAEATAAADASSAGTQREFRQGRRSRGGRDGREHAQQ